MKIFLISPRPLMGCPLPTSLILARGWQPGNFLNKIRTFWEYILESCY